MVKVKVTCKRCKNVFEHEVDLSGVIETEAKKRAQNLAPPKIIPDVLEVPALLRCERVVFKSATSVQEELSHSSAFAT